MKFEAPKFTKGNKDKFNFDAQILSQYTPGEAKEIKEKQAKLSVIAKFIGKDFNMPVFLSKPGGGWYWNFRDNYICIDPKDLLEKPMDYLEFVVAHEGGHRRVSRTEFIPDDILQTPGFLPLMNAIEDPRMNNFVAESYPRFREQMVFSYELNKKDMEKDLYACAKKVGNYPKYHLACLEYIHQWFREVQGLDFQIDERLPEDVKDVVQKTLQDAAISWRLYPQKEEVDGQKYIAFQGRQITGEEAVVAFAQSSYEINLQKIWPMFKSLIEKDTKNAEMNRLINQLKEKLKQRQEKQQSDQHEVPNPEVFEEDKTEEKNILDTVFDQLLEQDRDELMKQLEEMITQDQEGSENGEPGPEESLPLEHIPEYLLDELAKVFKELPSEIQNEIKKAAQEIIEEISKDFAESMQSRFEVQHAHEELKDGSTEDENSQGPSSNIGVPDALVPKLSPDEVLNIESAKEAIQRETERKIHNYENEYTKTMAEVLPVINSLEDDLRDIFTQRRSRGWQSGYKTGKKIDIARRIQEKAKGVNVFESTAWKVREAPTEQDYAITLLVDLSGSMGIGNKIQEAFKSVVVLSEVLNKLSLNVEILGFNDRLHVFQEYNSDLSEEVRGNIDGIIKELRPGLSKGNTGCNDDGYAIQESSRRLSKQQVSQKFLIVISDGQPAPSSRHSGPEYDLSTVIHNVTTETDQKLIGLGLGYGTGHVSDYYPNSIANISATEMAEKIGDLLRDIIINYQEY